MGTSVLLPQHLLLWYLQKYNASTKVGQDSCLLPLWLRLGLWDKSSFGYFGDLLKGLLTEEFHFGGLRRMYFWFLSLFFFVTSVLHCYQCGNNTQEYFYHPEGWLNLVAPCSCRARRCRVIREDPAVSGPDVPVEEKWGLKCTGSEANPGEMLPGIRHAESQAQDSVLLNTRSQQKFFPVKKLLNNATSIILSEASHEIDIFQNFCIYRAQTYNILTKVCIFVCEVIHASNN